KQRKNVTTCQNCGPFISFASAKIITARRKSCNAETSQAILLSKRNKRDEPNSSTKKSGTRLLFQKVIIKTASDAQFSSAPGNLNAVMLTSEPANIAATRAGNNPPVYLFMP